LVRIIFILGFFLLSTFVGLTQSKNYLKANFYFGIQEYTLAKPLLEKSIKQKGNKFYLGNIYFQLGECDRIANDSINRLYYLEAIDFTKRNYACGFDKQSVIKRLKLLAMCYYYLEDYEMALSWMKKYLKVRPEDCEVERLFLKLLENMDGKPHDSNGQ